MAYDQSSSLQRTTLHVHVFSQASPEKKNAFELAVVLWQPKAG